MTNERITASSQKSMPVSGERVPPIVQDTLGSQGQSLDAATRAFMEPRFGHDFSHVRIHTDARAAESAQAVNALAYTVGRNIAFGKGQYLPSTIHGQKLLAHELAHVVQQMHSPPSASIGFDDSHEQEAEAASAGITAAHPIVVARAPGPGLARQARSFTDIKKDILAELNRNMPVAILGMIDGLDKEMRDALDKDPDINQAIAALPPKTRSIIRRHLQSSAGIPRVIESVPGEMSRAQFEKIMKDRYYVKGIRMGTFNDQSQLDLTQESWKAWHPGSSSIIYDWIVEAFVNFEKTFGGVPPVNEIVFFYTRYENKDGKAVEDHLTPASYGAGQLTIYSALITSNEMFNLKRTLDKPTKEQAAKRNITHELGHGIVETALNQRTDQPPGADPDLLKDYGRAVGWANNGRLYDIQEAAVRAAIQNGTTPPADFLITKFNIDTKPWKELPLTRYMPDSAAEDFAEAIMAYVNEPERLKALSPTRFDFIDKRKSRWLASGQPKVNIWEQAIKGGPARTLKPSQPPTIWERAKEAK